MPVSQGYDGSTAEVIDERHTENNQPTRLYDFGTNTWNNMTAYYSGGRYQIRGGPHYFYDMTNNAGTLLAETNAGSSNNATNYDYWYNCGNVGN